MTGAELAALAARELGITESPPGSNQVKYNTWYYGQAVSGSAYPWCMVFVQWVFAQAGVSLPSRTASCGALMRVRGRMFPAMKVVSRRFYPSSFGRAICRLAEDFLFMRIW